MKRYEALRDSNSQEIYNCIVKSTLNANYLTVSKINRNDCVVLNNLVLKYPKCYIHVCRYFVIYDIKFYKKLDYITLNLICADFLYHGFDNDLCDDNNNKYKLVRSLEYLTNFDINVICEFYFTHFKPYYPNTFVLQYFFNNKVDLNIYIDTIIDNIYCHNNAQDLRFCNLLNLTNIHIDKLHTKHCFVVDIYHNYNRYFELIKNCEYDSSLNDFEYNYLLYNSLWFKDIFIDLDEDLIELLNNLQKFIKISYFNIIFLIHKHISTYFMTNSIMYVLHHALNNCVHYDNIEPLSDEIYSAYKFGNIIDVINATKYVKPDYKCVKIAYNRITSVLELKKSKYVEYFVDNYVSDLSIKNYAFDKYNCRYHVCENLYKYNSLDDVVKINPLMYSLCKIKQKKTTIRYYFAKAMQRLVHDLTDNIYTNIEIILDLDTSVVRLYRMDYTPKNTYVSLKNYLEFSMNPDNVL